MYRFERVSRWESKARKGGLRVRELEIKIERTHRKRANAKAERVKEGEREGGGFKPKSVTH